MLRDLKVEVLESISGNGGQGTIVYFFNYFEGIRETYALADAVLSISPPTLALCYPVLTIQTLQLCFFIFS